MFSALRLAVQAFKREEDSANTLKRRKERLEQVYTPFFPVYQLCFKFWQLYVLHVLKSILLYVRTNVAMMIQILLKLLEGKVCSFLFLSLTMS
jgi:hypothetical protein